MLKLALFLIVIFPLVYCSYNPVSLELNYSEPYTFTVNKTVLYILEFSGEKSNKPPRVTISSPNAEKAFPLMVVAQTTKQQLSWQVPLFVEAESFRETARTLCHDMVKHKKELGLQEIVHDNPIVTVSTASQTSLNFTVLVDYQHEFAIKPSHLYNLTISPSQPKYYFYNFSSDLVRSGSNDSNYDTVILEVESTDDVCMTVSIQTPNCPVLDLNQDITYKGFYETVSTRGGITIPKYKFPDGFYVVFVAKGDDFECTGVEGLTSKNRSKNISLIVKPSITYLDYQNAVAITVGGIVFFYVIFITSYFIYSKKNHRPRNMEYFDVSSAVSTPSASTANVENNCGDHKTLADTISLDEAEYDSLQEIDQDKELRLGKSVLYLKDLARKDPRVHKQKSYLYLYNVLTIALFYGLPVVQLVVTYQNVLNNTGQQDLCYYNFLCAHPLGFLSDFNHVFSNIGYILLGILFVFITYRREITHKDLNFDRNYGIPQHYGMFYAMGVALIMEGILSGSYHVCPNHSNFQFDSSFMYVTAVLCMVKLYQNRHPDINANSYSTFGVLAVAILLGMIGLLEGTFSFWITFTVLHIVICLYISAQMYYMGCWKCDRGLIMRIYRNVHNDFRAGPINVFKPTYTARFLLLLIGNVCNWLLAYFALSTQQTFALYLLGIFMANTLLYFFFYIIMKHIHKERVYVITWIFLILTTLCAISAMYFFLHKSISWAKTPAQSREYNQECKLLRFYDFHDIWHFLSAIGMFFTFMALLTLDDDLSHTPRSEIRVF